MDCPGCSRTCGQNDKFCSECGFNLRTVRSTFIDPDRVKAVELAVLTTQSRTPTVESNSQARRVTEPPDRGAEITGNEQEAKCEAQSGVESVNEQQGKTLAEHRTNKPATDADTDCLNEVTDSRSSLGQEPETASLYLTQSEPSTACLPKPDPKSGLTATDNVDPTMSKNKDTAQGEEEGTVNEEKGAKSGSQEKEETLDETADTHATDSDSSIDLYQEPAPETSSLGKSEPSTACPAKMDPKNDLTDSDSVDQGMSKDSKHTAQEEEEMEFEDASEYLEEQAKEAEDSKESMAMSADETISKGECKESVPMEGLTIEAVTSHSVSLSWRRPADVKDVLTYMVSYYSLGNQKKYSSTTSTSVVILNLKPAVLYTFTVKSHDHKGCKILDVSNTAHTELSVPGKLKVDSTDVTSATLSWSKPHGMEGTKHQFLVTFCSGAEPRQLSTSSLRATLSGLQPGTEYTATVSTVMGKRMSAAVSETFCTKPSPPQMINITSLEATSVTLAWGRPSGMKSSPHKFRVTWSQSGRPHLPIITKDNQAILSELKPGSEYTFSVCTVLDSSGVESTPVLSTARTNLPPPGEITIHRVTQDSVSLSWALPEGMENLPQSFKVSWVASSHKGYLNVKKQNGVTITKLLPGREYQISVATIGENSSQSKKVSVTSCTEPSAPGKVKAMDVKSTSVRLCWETPVGMEGVSYMIRIAYSCEGEEPRSNTHASNTTKAVLHELKPGKKYTFHITAVLPNHSCSKTSSTHVCTKTSLGDLVCDLGLEHHLKNKLTLSTVLEISGETLTDESVQSLKSLPWCFLRRLMMVNVTARSVRCITKEDTASQTLDNLLDTLNNPEGNSNVVNPLDLITAVFVCSDGFLQQEMVLKMSMCQFSVPLLLPKCDAQQCTLVLWAMRDIVKKFRPHCLADPRGFVEESIVRTNMPMVSFVRLGSSSLSKSHILNQVLSNPQQYHDTFVHKNMVCGDTPRRVSNGLVEVSWYLPCGNRNIDIFPEPVAIANLRGDLSTFGTQFSFLFQTSAAVFVFCDDFGFDCTLLNSEHMKGRWFLVCNLQSKSFNKDDFKRQVSELQLQPGNIIMKSQQLNDAEFVTKLRSAISEVLKGKALKMSIEQMSAVAHEFGIPVDEDNNYCQRGKQKADEITSRISDIPSYKEKELPLQGTTWKQIAKLEKEMCRLKKAGEKNLEIYKNELLEQKQKLWGQQLAYDISGPMSCFTSAMSSSKEERAYFLKWMRINLDNLSRKSLSSLRDKYKQQCKNSSENKELIAELDRKISSCSLGTEHFLREMGQLYESACSLPEGHVSRQQMQHLPGLCAELLLEGFPLELVDGDASNIPLQWVSRILKELHHRTRSRNKIRVVTVLGVQSTGKSTLLNTMFGVQFAVSSGRCTRGAFMLLIRVKEDFKKQLGCDYIMVIDTEGLKSPELAQLDDSYEHDNELATLVVGLSDITVINIAMENSTEMKDILQIVVHAFLRMKEVGKKPCCQFVHQNVPDISAHDKNMRDRKLLLEQLNEMTQAAAKMEKRGNNKKFTDVMVYDPERNNWYIPGLWHGNPPMAPVNAGYSESVYAFKKSMIEMFKAQESGKSSPQSFSEFTEWTRSLWEAVKYENFIFSFRNSLVADAYAKLCTEYNKWEWVFRKNMFSWLNKSETKISNFGTRAAQAQPSFNAADLLSQLKSEASLELSKGEKILLDNLTEYFERPEGHVHLVEKYKEDFFNTAKSVRRETENSVKNKLEAAVEIRKGMFRLEDIKKNHAATMEQKVLKLIERCRESKNPPTEKELDYEFGKMWDETVRELSFSGLDQRDIVHDIYSQLRANLEREGSSVHEMLFNVGSLVECGKQPFKVKSEAKELYMRIWNKMFGDEQKEKTQEMADYIIEHSKQFVAEKVKTKSDYHNTYMIDLLYMIDGNLNRHRNLETSAHFEACLKIHICGHAAREFQKMHLDFIRANDPRQCLEQFKQQYCADFKDLFYKRDQCQKKAEEFIIHCLAPAVREYITKSIGPDLVDEMFTGKKAVDFSTRSFFQFSILKQLLSDGNFQNLVQYISNYEIFVQEWILEQIVQQFTDGGSSLKNIENRHLKVIIKSIKEAVVNAQKKAREQVEVIDKEDGNIQRFIQDICGNLRKELVIPQDPLEAVLALNNAKPDEFSQCLMVLVNEMEHSFIAEFEPAGNVRSKLESLPFKPQRELFRRVFGCGRQCPFCKAPCEAGGKNHTEHFTSIHRPEGIGRVRDNLSCKLVIDVCSSCVASEARFCTFETEGKWHPYKDYRSIYSDWLIQPDSSIQASDYWKYVFATFNKKFSKEYEAEPADIPLAWRLLTKKQAMKSLEETFKTKKHDDE